MCLGIVSQNNPFRIGLNGSRLSPIGQRQYPHPAVTKKYTVLSTNLRHVFLKYGWYDQGVGVTLE